MKRCWTSPGGDVKPWKEPGEMVNGLMGLYRKGRPLPPPLPSPHPPPGVRNLPQGKNQGSLGHTAKARPHAVVLQTFCWAGLRAQATIANSFRWILEGEGDTRELNKASAAERPCSMTGISGTAKEGSRSISRCKDSKKEQDCQGSTPNSCLRSVASNSVPRRGGRLEVPRIEVETRWGSGATRPAHEVAETGG